MRLCLMIPPPPPRHKPPLQASPSSIVRIQKLSIEAKDALFEKIRILILESKNGFIQIEKNGLWVPRTHTQKDSLDHI